MEIIAITTNISTKEKAFFLKIFPSLLKIYLNSTIYIYFTNKTFPSIKVLLLGL